MCPFAPALNPHPVSCNQGAFDQLAYALLVAAIHHYLLDRSNALCMMAVWPLLRLFSLNLFIYLLFYIKTVLCCTVTILSTSTINQNVIMTATVAVKYLLRVIVKYCTIQKNDY